MGVINYPVKPKAGEDLLAPGYFRNGIATAIRQLNGSNKQWRLFAVNQQFQWQCQFHGTKITNIFSKTKKISEASLTSQPLKIAGFHAPTI